MPPRCLKRQKVDFSESDFAPKRVEGAYLAADSSGEVYASFGPRKVKILSDGVSELGPSFHSILSFGKDGTKIVKMGGDAYWQKGKTLKKLAAKDAAGAAALFEGGFFVCGSDGLWRISPDGDDKLVDSNLRSPAAVALSANGDWLYVFEYLSRRGYSYRISREGIASLKQEFFFLHIPEYADCAQSLAAACDISGYTYVATSYGVQVCDYNGRSEAILPLPDGGAALAVCFGGKDLSTLFVLSQYGTVFSRKLRAKGSSIFEKPVKIRVGAG